MTERDETYLGEAWAVVDAHGRWLGWDGWGEQRARRLTWAYRSTALDIARRWHRERPHYRPRVVRIVYRRRAK